MTKFEKIRSKIGYQALFEEKDFFEGIDFALDNGFRAMEANLTSPNFYPEKYSREDRSRIREYSEDKGIDLLLHAPEGLNFLNPQKLVREALFTRMDELVQLSLKDIISSESDWSRLIEETSSKDDTNFEIESLRKNESRVPVEISTSKFKIEEKPVMLTLLQAISERVKFERKLKASEEKYRNLFECIPDAIIVLNTHGDILDINKCALELFGLEEKNVLNNNFLSMDLLTPESKSTVIKQFEELLSDKITKNNETQIKIRNGKILNVELISFFLLKQDDEVDNFVVSIRDLSDREQFEIKLAKEHKMLRTLINNISDPVYFKDEYNRFVFVNNAKAAQYNVKPEEMIGKTDFDFLPEDQAIESSKDDEELMKTGKSIVNNVRKITDSDGSTRLVSIMKMPRFDLEGNIIGTMCISRDIIC